MRKTGIMLVLLLMVALVSGTMACEDEGEEVTTTPTPGYEGGAYTFRVPHQSLAGTIEADMWEYTDERLQYYTDGQVKLEIFPAGSLYRSLEQWDALATGSVDIIGISDWEPPMQGMMDWILASLPFFWGEAMDDTLDHDMRFWEHPEGGQRMLVQLEESGIKSIGWIPGSSLIMGLTRDIELESYHDMEGLRAMGLPDLFVQAVGAKSPFGEPGETVIAFPDPFCDLFFMSPDSILSQKLYESARYGLVLDPVSVHTIVSMNLDLWNSLSPELQQLFTTNIIPEVQEWMLKNALPHDEWCIDELVATHGMVINRITREERLDLRDMAFELAKQKGYLAQIDPDLLILADRLRSEPYDAGHFFP